jgi:glycogen(starch) synthase
MRVALLSRSAHPLHPPGGLERAVYHLAKHLRRAGVETILLTRPATTGTQDFPGEVVTVDWGAGGARHGGVVDRTLRYPGFAERLGSIVAGMVRDGRVDVVHAQGLTALGYARRRRRDATLAAPVVMNPQGMEEHKTKGVKRLALTRLRALSRRAAQLADCVIATDEVTREEVERLLGVPSRRVRVLPNGIDPEEIRASTPEDPAATLREVLPGLAEAHPVLLSVGRLEAYKGFGDVLTALRDVSPSLPPTWAWVVVGEGPERRALEARVAGAGALAGHAHFAGRVDDAVLHALYERADVFVHATQFEGSSLVTLEAMAHRLPVVATRAGGIPDKVSGETGRLVEPGDVAALGRALLEVSGDPAVARALGERGRERALDAFAWPRIAERTVALYEELLAEAGR